MNNNSSRNVLELTERDFSSEKGFYHIPSLSGQDGFLLVYADWCPHCVTFKPKFQESAESGVYGNAPFAQVNEKNKKVMAMLKVKGFPTVLGIHNGYVVNKEIDLNTFTV